MTSTPKSAKLPSPSKSVNTVTLFQFRAEYKTADDFCQEVTSFIDEAGIPALNELRNAGHHFLCALDDSGNIADMNDLIAARNHARRAAYEAYEAGILFALGIIAKFKEDYSKTPVDGTVPSYTDLLKTAKAAQKSVEQGRQNGFDRTGDHSVRMSAFRELRACAETLSFAREEMNKKRDLASEATSRNSEQARIARKTFRIGVVAIIAAIAIALWTAVGFWPLNRTDQIARSSATAVTSTAKPAAIDQTTGESKQTGKR
jgi:hypothetical protein